MKIIAVRHGETAYNKQKKIQGHIDIPLSNSGKDQARELSKKIFNYIGCDPIISIFSSDLIRAKETALPFLEILKSGGKEIKIIYREDLREINLGVWEGKTILEIIKETKIDNTSLFEIWLEDPVNVIPQGGESMPRFFKRISNFMEFLKKEYGKQEGYIVIFTHTGVMSMMLNYLNKRTPENFIRFTFKNAGGPVLEYVNGEFVEVDKIEVESAG